MQIMRNIEIQHSNPTDQVTNLQKIMLPLTESTGGVRIPAAAQFIV